MEKSKLEEAKSPDFQALDCRKYYEMDDLGYLLYLKNGELGYSRDKSVLNNKKKIVFKGLEEIVRKNKVSKMSVSERAHLFIEKSLSNIPSESEDEQTVRQKIKKAVEAKKKQILANIEKKKRKNSSKDGESMERQSPKKRKKRRKGKNSTVVEQSIE